MYVLRFSDRKHERNHRNYYGYFMNADNMSCGFPVAVKDLALAKKFDKLDKALYYREREPYLDIFEVKVEIKPVEL